MGKIKCLLLEDLESFAQEMEETIKGFYNLELIGSYKNTDQLIDVINRENIELIFADIDLGQDTPNGFDFFRTNYKNIKTKPFIIFITVVGEEGKIKPRSKGWDLDFRDRIEFVDKRDHMNLGNNIENRIIRTINKILSEKLLINIKSCDKHGIKSYIIENEKVLLIESDGNYTIFYALIDKAPYKLWVHQMLKDVYNNLLNPDFFIRFNRFSIVPRNRISGTTNIDGNHYLQLLDIDDYLFEFLKESMVDRKIKCREKRSPNTENTLYGKNNPILHLIGKEYYKDLVRFIKRK